MQINPPTKKQLNVFVFGLILILLIFSRKLFRVNNGKISLLLIGIAFILVIIYLTKKDFVIQFYKIWMKCTSWIGAVITTILMLCIFYLVFTPIGLLVRLFRKDLLSLNKNPKLKTYWIDKPQKKFNKEDYEKQF